MRWIGIVSCLLLLGVSCTKDNGELNEYVLKNVCSFTIDVFSSAMVQYPDGSKVETIHDQLAAGQSVSLRIVPTYDGMQVADVFTNIEVYKDESMIQMDLLQEQLWDLNTSDNKTQYTLTIIPSFFNN